MADRGPWMHTFSGTQFYPMDPRPEDIHIQDVAHHLAFQNRYNGATIEPYSVAEHSFWCSHLCAPKFAKEALLHDLAEAYLGDVTRPVKIACGRNFQSAYGNLERLILQAAAERFRFRYPFPQEVIDSDNYVLESELVHIEAREPVGLWPDPKDAMKQFLKRFHELFGEDK